MVGRGPLQLMFPSNPNNVPSYSNEVTNKMESFDIPVIKQEPVHFMSTVPTTKYPEYHIMENSYQHVVPQEMGIYVLPIEHPSNNPYKQQDDSTSQPLLFEKQPAFVEDTNWTQQGANVLVPPSSFLYNEGKQLEKKEDEFLTQLLDIGGFLGDFDNDMYIPLNDTFIPTGGESPVNQGSPYVQDSNYITPQTSPMQMVPAQYNHYENDVNLPVNGLKAEEYDPLVSGANECLSSPPNKETVEPTNEIVQPNDDLKDLLGELLSQDELLLTNSFDQTYFTDENLIPSSSSAVQYSSWSLPINFDEETNHIPSYMEEETIIPSSSFDLPPATKKPRGLEEVHQLIGDVPKAMEAPPPPDDPKRKPTTLPMLSATPSPVEIPAARKSKSRNSSSSSSGTSIGTSSGSMLFGQNEEEIIQKLLAPQNSEAAKPITRDKLVVMAVEEFNALLDGANLTEIEVAFMKEWRRRGKNKMAAQIARKRKREELSDLEVDMNELHRKKSQLQQSVKNLEVLVASFKRRALAAEERIYKHYSAAHGSFVSQETHTIHITEDGKTMLIPRVSSQILLV